MCQLQETLKGHGKVGQRWRWRLKCPWRVADLMEAKLLSSSSIAALHHSAQRQPESRLQAAALNNSWVCYRAPLVSRQYLLSLRLSVHSRQPCQRDLEGGCVVWEASHSKKSSVKPAGFLQCYTILNSGMFSQPLNRTSLAEPCAPSCTAGDPSSENGLFALLFFWISSNHQPERKTPDFINQDQFTPQLMKQFCMVGKQANLPVITCSFQVTRPPLRPESSPLQKLVQSGFTIDG